MPIIIRYRIRQQRDLIRRLPLMLSPRNFERFKDFLRSSGLDGDGIAEFVRWIEDRADCAEAETVGDGAREDYGAEKFFEGA